MGGRVPILPEGATPCEERLPPSNARSAVPWIPFVDGDDSLRSRRPFAVRRLISALLVRASIPRHSSLGVRLQSELSPLGCWIASLASRLLIGLGTHRVRQGRIPKNGHAFHHHSCRPSTADGRDHLRNLLIRGVPRLRLGIVDTLADDADPAEALARALARCARARRSAASVVRAGAGDGMAL